MQINRKTWSIVNRKLSHLRRITSLIEEWAERQILFPQNNYISGQYFEKRKQIFMALEITQNRKKKLRSMVTLGTWPHYCPSHFLSADLVDRTVLLCEAGFGIQWLPCERLSLEFFFNERRKTPAQQHSQYLRSKQMRKVNNFHLSYRYIWDN